MKYFFKINENGKAVLGRGNKIPDGFTEYTKGQEPKELLDALLIDLKKTKKQAIKSALNNYLKVYNLPNGVNIINTLQEQSNNLNSLLLSQMAIKSNEWAKSTDYKVNDVVYSNSVLLLCITAGTSDSNNNPTPPTEYGVTVTDGSVKWAKLGFLVKTDKGRVYFTPQEIIKMSEDATSILHNALIKYNSLKQLIEQCDSKDCLDKIIW